MDGVNFFFITHPQITLVIGLIMLATGYNCLMYLVINHRNARYYEQRAKEEAKQNQLFSNVQEILDDFR